MQEIIIEKPTETIITEDRQDKVVIITHGDCDGICSAAITLKYYKQAELIFSQPFLLKKVLYNDDRVKDADILVILDLALDDHVVNALIKIPADIVVIDHHPQSSKYNKAFDGLIDTSMSTSQLTAIYYRIPTLLAEIGAIADKIIMVNRKDKLFNEAELIRESLSYDISDNDFRIMLCNMLANDVLPSEIEEVVVRSELAKQQKTELAELATERIKYDDKFIFVDATDLDIEGKVSAIAGMLTITYQKPTFILFKTNDNTYVLSGRNYHGIDIDLDVIMKRFGGGGHKNAASARIKYPENILEELKNILGE